MKVLFVGESWVINSTHIKGFDQFTETTYGEGGKWFIEALEKAGIEVTYMPCHIAVEQFPTTREAIDQFDAVILSDIGASSLLLTQSVFSKGETLPNRLNLIRDYVNDGGGFAMMGGYMSFAGIDGKSKYAHTAIADILPVVMMESDDRYETPEGVIPKVVSDTHPILTGISKEWPHFLGYNMLFEKEGADVIVVGDKDHIFMAAQEYGKGRTFAFASDIAPHWGSPAFMEWESYDLLFANIAKWLAKEI